MRRKSERTKSTSSPVRSVERSSRRSSRRGKGSPTKSPEPDASQADQHNEDKVSETEVDGDNEKTRDSSTDRDSEDPQSRGRRQTRRASRSDDRATRASRRKIETIEEETGTAHENGESSLTKGDSESGRKSSEREVHNEAEDAKRNEKSANSEEVKEQRRSSKSEDTRKDDSKNEKGEDENASPKKESISQSSKDTEPQPESGNNEPKVVEKEPDKVSESNKDKSPPRDSDAEEPSRGARNDRSSGDADKVSGDHRQRSHNSSSSSDRRPSDGYDRRSREQRENRKSKSDESTRSSDREHRHSRSSSGKDRSVEKDYRKRSGSSEKERPKENDHTIRRTSEKSTEDRNEEKENKKASDETGKTNKDSESKSERQPPVRKRRWLSRKASDSKPQVLAISTDSLKNLISDVEPVPLSDIKLESSPEPEERRSKSPSEEPDRREKEKSRSHRDRRSRERDGSKKREEKSLQNSNRKISIIPDDGKLQRPPSPPRNVSSCILYITNLVRPFTLLQLKGLLARTGKIVENGFWMDRIKSQCYVKYETEDQAIETRHALHGVRWPTSNPKCLNVDFDTEEAMEKAIASTLEETPRFGAENPRENRGAGAGWDARERFDYDEKKDIQVSRPVREWDVGKKEELEREMERNREREREHRERRDGRGGRRHSNERDRDNVRDRQNRSNSASPARKFRNNDIALIELTEDARLGADIKLIKLPSDSEAKKTFVGDTVVASGWGRPSDSASAVSEVLRYTDLKVITETECKKYFGSSARSTNICTSGADKKSTCNGDSGGPLAYGSGDNRVVIGLTSYGSASGCEKGYPAVFTRVGSYLDWIKARVH